MERFSCSTVVSSVYHMHLSSLERLYPKNSSGYQLGGGGSAEISRDMKGASAI